MSSSKPPSNGNHASNKLNPMQAVVACSITWGLGAGIGYPLNLHHLFIISEIIQLIVGIPSIIMQNEIYFDFTGSSTFIILTAISLTSSFQVSLFDPSTWYKLVSILFNGPSASPLQFRRIIVSLFIFMWALRLGYHLHTRMLHDKEDKRFALIRVRPLAFLSYWVLQGFWVFIVSLPAHIINLSSTLNTSWNITDYIGILLFFLGWILEIIADSQKRVFRQDPQNRDKYINEGVWTWSRHPNYAGEILLWIGIVIITSSSLQGVQWLAVISPMFTYFLLNYVSGIPLLEASANKKWGGESAYQEYKRRTPVLWPFIGSRG